MAGENSSSAHGTAAPEQQQATGILKIVWLRQMLQGWQSTAAGNTAGLSDDASASGGQQDDSAGHRVQDEDTTTRHVRDDDKKPLLAPTPAESADRRPRMVEEKDHGGGGSRECDLWGDEREDDPGSEPMTPETGAPVDVPRGCCAVYVGTERRRFVVPTAYLGMQVFRRLLEKAEEEFGFDYEGGALTIPCETEVFKYILVVMDRHQKGLVDDEGNPKKEEEGGEESPETRH